MYSFRDNTDRRLPVRKMLLSRKAFLLLAIGFFILFSSSCSMIGGDGIQAVVADRSAKVEQLDKRIKDFHAALYWGLSGVATGFVVPDKRSNYARTYSKRKKKEKVVDIEVDHVELVASGKNAVVSVTVRYFSSPSYVVHSREEEQNWVFERFDGGWFIEDHKLLEES